jgi:hypothetical protein
VAVDATGLAQEAVSTYFVRRLHQHGQKPLPWRHWLKWLIVADLDQQFLLSQRARRGPWNDCGSLPAVVEAASQQRRISLVLADAEFDSERNHTYIRQRLGAHSVIPAKRGKKNWRICGVRAETRRAFPQKLYRRRALIETVFSSVKRKLSAHAPGRSLRMQTRLALLLGLSFNLYRLKHRYLLRGMSTEPKKVWTAFAIESPETTYSAAFVPANIRGLNTSQNAASGVNLLPFLPNYSNGFSTNLAPDLLAKVTFEPGRGHFEIKALGRFFRDRNRINRNNEWPYKHHRRPWRWLWCANAVCKQKIGSIAGRPPWARHRTLWLFRTAGRNPKSNNWRAASTARS